MTIKKFRDFVAATTVTEAKKKVKESIQSDVGLNFTRLSGAHLTQILDNTGYKDCSIRTSKYVGKSTSGNSFHYKCVFNEKDEDDLWIEGDVYISVNNKGEIEGEF